MIRDKTMLHDISIIAVVWLEWLETDILALIISWASPLKGSFTVFLFLVRTHILDSNGVWYS